MLAVLTGIPSGTLTRPVGLVGWFPGKTKSQDKLGIVPNPKHSPPCHISKIAVLSADDVTFATSYHIFLPSDSYLRQLLAPHAVKELLGL